MHYASQLIQKETCPHIPALGRGQSGEIKGTLKVPGKEHSVSSTVFPGGASLRLLERNTQAAPTAWVSPASTMLDICPLPHVGLL